MEDKEKCLGMGDKVTTLSGVTIDENAIFDACSVVIKYLDADKFN